MTAGSRPRRDEAAAWLRAARQAETPAAIGAPGRRLQPRRAPLCKGHPRPVRPARRVKRQRGLPRATAGGPP